MSRDALEGLEGSDLDLPVALAWLVRDAVPFEDAALRAARRRALLVLAAGGDPHRDVDVDDVVTGRLAAELDSPERRRSLDDALATLDTSGLSRVAGAVAALRSDPERAWRTLALALLADELADYPG